MNERADKLDIRVRELVEKKEKYQVKEKEGKIFQRLGNQYLG